MTSRGFAELYTLLELLGDGRLFVAENVPKKSFFAYLEMLKGIRKALETGVLEYTFDEKCDMVDVRTASSNVLLTRFPLSELHECARRLITDNQGISTSPNDSYAFAQTLYTDNPGEHSAQELADRFDGENDICIQVRNAQNTLLCVMGISIKSEFSSSPTLLDASPSSQYVFEVVGCNDGMMTTFNDILATDRFSRSACRDFLRDNRLKIEFVGMRNAVYENNMYLVRESMSRVMAWCAHNMFLNATENLGVMETIQRMILENPLGVNNPAVYYVRAMKDFLMANFTGMTATRAWDGIEQVNGGYIIVLKDGNVMCCHSTDRESFRDYLYRNCCFEYAGAVKSKQCHIDKYNGRYYLPMNLSIRLLKELR